MKNLNSLWETYTQVAPQAARIKTLLEERGDTWVNDHVAFRLFGCPGQTKEDLAQRFEGYEVKGHYDFQEKHLRALHLEKPGAPKIFISEFKWEELQDPELAQLVQGPDLQLGRPWLPTWDLYLRLAESSEYLSWLLAHGLQANHFTVLVNQLKTFDNLESLNSWLEDQDFPLNDSGGKIKAGPGLRQSSTFAAKVPVHFAHGPEMVPGCYVEFAERSNGFEGFIEGSADKIFESTRT